MATRKKRLQIRDGKRGKREPSPLSRGACLSHLLTSLLLSTVVHVVTYGHVSPPMFLVFLVLCFHTTGWTWRDIKYNTGSERKGQKGGRNEGDGESGEMNG